MMKVKMKASYMSPEVDIIKMETESVLAISNSGFFGEEDSFVTAKEESAQGYKVDLFNRQ